MNILIINDICSHGQVATNSIKPPLQKSGANVYNIPTCLISSTFNNTPVAISDTTDYLSECLDIYSKKVQFDYIIIGFVYNKTQADNIIEFVNTQTKATVIVDPTMADNGKLYKTLDQSNLDYIKELCKVSDLIIPNITEARFLVDDFCSDIDIVIDKLKKKYNSIIITSIDNKQIFVYDKKVSKENLITYEKIEGNYPGTGDLFVGLMIAHYISVNDLCDASKHSATKISEILKEAKADIDIYNGIPINKYL